MPKFAFKASTFLALSGPVEKSHCIDVHGLEGCLEFCKEACQVKQLQIAEHACMHGLRVGHSWLTDSAAQVFSRHLTKPA